MPRRHWNNSYEAAYTDEETEITYVVDYIVTPHIPAKGPSFSDPGSPAEGPDLIVNRITPEPPSHKTDEIRTWIAENHDYEEDY